MAGDIETKRACWSSDPELDAALKILEEIRTQKGVTLESMAKMVAGVLGLKSFDTSKLFRWLRYQNPKCHRATKAEIIDVATRLNKLRQAPPLIRCGILTQSSESLLASLLREMPQTELNREVSVWQDAGIRVEIDTGKELDYL